MFSKPKGVIHTTGGYLLCAAITVKYVFDVHPDDKFGCMADSSWITGHTYVTFFLNHPQFLYDIQIYYVQPSRQWSYHQGV